MAKEPDPQFAEDEDLERARAFWNENGRSIIAGVVIGVAAIVGYNGWQSWQQTQGENASTLFENMQDPDVSLDAARSLADDLMDDYGGTPYAAHAAMLMAKKSIEAETPDTGAAANYLQWVLDNTEDQALIHVSRLRLAQVHLAAGDHNAALTTIASAGAAADSGPFAARYQELKGDAEAGLGNEDSARAAWEQSRELLGPGSATASLLKLKLDNLGKL